MEHYQNSALPGFISKEHHGDNSLLSECHDLLIHIPSPYPELSLPLGILVLIKRTVTQVELAHLRQDSRPVL